MGEFLRTELSMAATLQPGDVVAGSWGLTRVLWSHTPHDGGQVTLWWPDTTSVYLPPALLVLMVTRPEPPHELLGPERVARVRSAALGATWLRHIGHAGAPGDVVYSMLCGAYSRVVECGPDVPSELLLAVLSARAQLYGPDQNITPAGTPGAGVNSWN